MAWREETSGGLPDPEQWGPQAGQIQQDIRDELSDHLGCALSQELRETTDGDEASARARVLEKFGNPRKLAKSLWFAAMKEQMMNNRIMMGTNIVLAIAVIAICIFTFSAMNRNNEVTEAMLARLETFATPPASETPPEWGRVTARVISEDPQGRPASDFHFSLYGNPFNSPQSQSIEGDADEDGTYTFGAIRAGSYSLTTSFPNGEENRTKVVLYPGGHTEAEIHFQRPVPKQEQFSFDWDIPAEIKSAIAYAVVEFSTHSFRNPDYPDESWEDKQTIRVLVRADGQAAIMDNPRDVFSYLDNDRVKIESGKLQFEDRLELDNSIQQAIQLSKLYLIPENTLLNIRGEPTDLAVPGDEYVLLDYRRPPDPRSQSLLLRDYLNYRPIISGNPNTIKVTLSEKQIERVKTLLPAHNDAS